MDESLETEHIHRIAVVIPCYKVRKHIVEVVQAIGPEVQRIYIVDDGCPEASGKFVEDMIPDARIHVLRTSVNLGVGGAVKTGYRQALRDGMHVVVKIDGDGQMEPSLIPRFIAPILGGRADYTKGNRFFRLQDVSSMPTIRVFGNAFLSFFSKLSSGYWNIFDPTNGFIAIHTRVLANLPLENICDRWFFESDMLFRLNIIRAKVIDIPMSAKYREEKSNLSVRQVGPLFLAKHCLNFCKRIFYNYYLRDMTIASIELPVGLLMFLFGATYGVMSWSKAYLAESTTPPGTVMLAALPVIVGIQLILGFLNYDMAHVPEQVLHPDLPEANELERYIESESHET